MSKLLDELNSSQREAVTHKTGPLLIIAGPGSGKTRTIVHSIAYAIEKGVLPDRILAFSFTVKASEELRNRVKEIVGKEKGDLVNISTFHSFCRQVLRDDIDKLGRGYTPNFRALEEKDQRKIVKDLTRINERRVRAEVNYIQSHRFPKTEDILNFIKKCKAREISPLDAGSQVPDPDNSEAYIKIYESYEQHLRTNSWIDYESQQIFTDKLLREVSDVKGKWQDKFELIFVDEYQDTDPVQYRIIETLAKKHLNLRVVGDDDQGIYGWRGADIQNILNFERDYPNAKIIPLGQNYRSTQKIVETSCALAEFNPDRREKELFTRNFEGERVKYLHCENDEEEASAIATFVHRAVDEGSQLPSDFAVLYRTNKQAYVFRKAFDDLGIRCRIVHDSSDTDITAVSLMTIHKSKGLEFPNVFVTGICQDLLPHYYNSDEKDWDEELRLLYVAMTRAKNWLCLSSYEEEVESQRKRGCSPFLERGYVPTGLLESVETLENIPIPPSPEEMVVQIDPEEAIEYVEPLPEKLLGDGMTVLGIDPGIQNVGWAITQKSFAGYTVLKYDTQTTREWQDTLVQTENTINKLIDQHRPDAIAVEKLEGAREEWFRYVAGCVATIRSIAHQSRIECYLYTPQHVKYVAAGDRNASKEDVQKGVRRVCSNLQEIPEPHHSADAIATSLCYLRSYLNSSRFEGKKQAQEHYNSGLVHLDNKKYSEAINGFSEAVNIDPIDAKAHYGMGRAYFEQRKLTEAENSLKETFRLENDNYQDAQKLLNAIDSYHSGCNCLNNSEWNIAIDKFQESINLEPIFTEAHCELGRAYLKVGSLEAAKNATEAALKLRDDYPAARKLLYDVKMKSYYKGKTYFNRKEYDQAIFELQRAVEIDRGFKGAYLYLGKTYFKLGDLEAAEKETRDALRVDLNYELASELLEEIKKKHKEQGDDYRKKKVYTEALKSYQHAIRIDDKYKDAYNNLGIVYRNMKEYEKAVEAYQRAIDIDARCHVIHNNLSIVYRRIGEYAKAVSSLKWAIAIKPDYQTAYYNLARTYFKMENLQEASKTVLEALRLDINDRDALKLLKDIQHAHLKQGRNYFRRSNLEAAEISAKAALRLDSDYQPGHKLLANIKRAYYKQGLASTESGKYAEAIGTLQKAIEIDSDFKEAHCLLGEAYFKIRDLEGAEKEAREVLRIDSNDELVSHLLESIKEEYYKRGLTSLEQNKWKSAEKFAKKVLKIESSDQPAYRLLKQAYYGQGCIHIKKGAYVKGINILQKAKDIDPNCEETRYYLGWSYFRLNRLKDAQMMIEEALSIQPNYFQAHKLLSEIKDARNWLRSGRKKARRLARWIINRIGF